MVGFVILLRLIREGLELLAPLIGLLVLLAIAVSFVQRLLWLPPPLSEPLPPIRVLLPTPTPEPSWQYLPFVER